MNKTVKHYAMLIALLSAFGAKAQVGIGTNNPDASAQLEVLSTSKGLLIPRMTILQRNDINNPANGLLIYQTNNTPGFYYYNNGQWQRLVNNTESGSGGGNGPAGNTILNGNTVPAAGIGTNGDFYLHTGTNTLYGPKTAGNWPINGIQLIGPKGEQGPAGPKGEQGTPGNSLPGSGKTVTSGGTIDIINGKDAVLTDLRLDLADNAVTSAKIKDGSIENADLNKAAIPLSGFGPPLKNISLGGFKITNLGNPTNNQDAATKKYVDDKLGGPGGNQDLVLSFDGVQNLSIKGGNTVSLGELSQSLSLAGTVLSISGPRNSHVDLQGLLGNNGGGGGNTNVVHDGTLNGSGTTGSPLGLSNTGVVAGVYNAANITIDAKGRIISAANGTGGGGGSGSVTSVAVASANGFTGSVTNPSSTPEITLGTSVNGVLMGNAGAITAAPTTGSGAVVLADKPVLNQPDIGNATGNISGTAGNVTGVVAVANGGTGATTPAGARANLGLDKVSNTADLDKPISTATQAALDLKEDKINKSLNVTTDAASDAKYPSVKAIKTYVDDQINQVVTGGGVPDAAAAVKGKIQLAGDLTGTAAAPLVANDAITTAKIKNGSVTDDKIAGINASKITGTLGLANGGTGATTAAGARTNLGLDKVNNTADLDKPVSTATQTALDLKEDKLNKSVNVTTDAASDQKYPTVKATKTYVDEQISQVISGGAVPDATISSKGKIQLAGDLTGTAEAPLIANDAITTAKIKNGNVTDDKIATVSGTKVTGNITGNAANVTGIVGVANGGTGVNNLNDLKKNMLLDKVNNTADVDKPVSIAMQAALDLKEDKANKSTDGTLNSASDDKYPTEKATKTYVDKRVNDAVIGAGGVPDATTTTLGKIQLSGDLSGTATNPRVLGLDDKEPKFDLLPVSKGGTGISTYTAGNLLSALNSTTLTQVTPAQAKVALGLDKVDNTSDAGKPVSTATQTKLNDKIDKSEKAANNGVATLDNNGKIPSNQIPAISFSTVNVLNSQAAMLGLSNPTVGSTVIRTDENKSYVLAATPGSVLANWKEILTPGSGVQSVNGKTGAVTLDKTNVGLSNADNTSDLAKPISTLTQTALDGKEDQANKSININTDGTSDIKYPSVKAVKAYVDGAVLAGAPVATTTTKGILKLAGDLGNNADLPTVTKVGGSDAASINTATIAANAATAAATPNTIVKRDASGNFAAGTITANLTGNASTATSATSAGKLTTARTINGVAFDGTANITLPGTADATKQDKDADLTAIAGLSSTGFIVRTSDGAATTRSITAGAGLSMVNGSGVGGDPAISMTSTGVTAGAYTTANITVDAQGRITAASNGVASGGGTTNLGYSADATQGVVTSSTGASATITAGLTDKASLMIPADKKKLDKITDFTSADASKVLTVNAAGTAAAWVTPATGGGSGGGTTLIGYNPGNNKKFFARATGPGVTATWTTSNTITITIPAGVTLNYFKFTSSYAELGSQNFLNIAIIDKGAGWNNSIEDVVVPVVNIVDITVVNPVINVIHSPATTNFPLNVTGYSNGTISLQTNSLGNHTSTNGFYVTIRP